MNAGFKQILAEIAETNKSTGERITNFDQRIISIEKSTGERFTKLKDTITTV